MKKYVIAAVFIFITSNALADHSSFVKHDAVVSSDSETIAYSVYGSGDTALVFVHGWAGDRRYWANQLEEFSKNYTLITLDLAGHGNSSANRVDFTMKAFAKDVQAVLDAEEVKQAILIGHSMGGAVIASAAQNMPQQVQGLIGVDTFHDVAAKRTKDMIAGAMKPFNENYQQTMGRFLGSLFSKTTNTDLKNWISKDMASAPQSVAVSALHNFMSLSVTGESASVAASIKVPVIAINATLRPTNAEGNQKALENFQLVYIQETGHFPMLEKPQEFNGLLLDAIKDIQSAAK